MDYLEYTCLKMKPWRLFSALPSIEKFKILTMAISTIFISPHPKYLSILSFSSFPECLLCVSSGHIKMDKIILLPLSGLQSRRERQICKNKTIQVYTLVSVIE